MVTFTVFSDIRPALWAWIINGFREMQKCHEKLKLPTKSKQSLQHLLKSGGKIVKNTPILNFFFIFGS